MIGRGAAVMGAVMLSACTHYNTLYNAERVYRSAERDRLAGRDSTALLQYEEVVQKTSDAFRSHPEDERAAAILFLLGRAHLRAGDARAAADALERAADLAAEPGLLPRVMVYQAVAEAALGELGAAKARLDEALAAGVTGEALAEARLLRGSLELARGPSDAAWADLEAAGGQPGVRIEAGLDRLRLSIRHGERERAREAISALMADPAAGARLDEIVALVDEAGSKWGLGEASALFAAADSARWEPPQLGRARIAHGELLRASGDTAGARVRVERVAAGRSEAAAEARLLLARWSLASARDLGSAASVRVLLLPASGDLRVDSVLRALDDLERYAGQGLDAPLGWFAAAEVARDRLGAPVLARGFFLAYADFDPTSPWAPKALLAALAVSSDEADRDWLRGRLEGHPASPYVLAARGHGPAELEALEEELRLRLEEMTER